MGLQTGAATVEVPQKIKNRTACDPVVSLLDIPPKTPETLIQENIRIPVFTAVFYNSQDSRSTASARSRRGDGKQRAHNTTERGSDTKEGDLPSAEI